MVHLATDGSKVMPGMLSLHYISSVIVYSPRRCQKNSHSGSTPPRLELGILLLSCIVFSGEECSRCTCRWKFYDFITIPDIEKHSVSVYIQQQPLQLDGMALRKKRATSAIYPTARLELDILPQSCTVSEAECCHCTCRWNL